jgi:GLPGLI family protein
MKQTCILDTQEDGKDKPVHHSSFIIHRYLHMKHLLFYLISIVCPVYASAQINIRIGDPRPVKQEVVDTGVMRVLYETQSVNNPLKPEETDKDYHVLEIGEKGISRFYSDSRRRQDSILMELIKTTNSSRSIDFSKALKDNGISSNGDPKEVFKNFPSGKITVIDNIGRSDYLYEDDLNLIQWQILPETKDILSYTCQKASADFRGRHFEAWFAPDLPINDGPWKFSGLPGLILAVEDSDKHYIFQAIGVENLQQPILFPKKDFVKASRKEVDKVRKRHAEDPIGSILNSTPEGNVKIVVKKPDGTEMDANEMKAIKNPYNPIELE